MRGMIIGLAAVALLVGCTSAHHPAQTTGTATSHPPMSHASTSTAKATAKPTPTPTGPIPVGPVKAVEGDCPYISVTDAATNEGNRIDKHFVLMARGKVVGCRFLFWTDAYAVLEITKQTYASADAAYNAMVRIGKRGANFHGVQDLVPGVDGILYQTTFYEVDGPTDWACTFATGRTVVTVKTAQNNVEFNARAIAKAIAPKF
ncbi:MAG TPA: hypothetical protein VEL02_08365 [Jatrophihabitantaceae bacterium]|nr:hypothetical protein [Jatrophihabitantaceae bacterium]